MKEYKVGIIGSGFIARVHAYGYLNLPLFYDQQEFKVTVKTVCAAHQSSADKFAAQIGAAKAVTDFRAVIDDPEIDIIDIASPNDCHCEQLLAAMNAGKHIYCDKPLTANAAEADQIAAVLPSYRGVSQMTLQNRFFPATLRAKQLIDEGRIGEILEFRGQYLHSGSADPNAPLKWKLEAGTIADLGSHILDLVDYLTGGFKSVCAATHIAYPDRPSAADKTRRLPVTAEDNMHVLATLANGACGVVTASKIATGAEDEIGFAIHGSKGALRLDPMNWDKLHFYDMSKSSSPMGGEKGWCAIDCGQRYAKPAGFPTPKAAIGWMRGHMHCLWNFLSNVHAGTPGDPGLSRGIYIQHMMEKIRKSAQSAKWLDI
ncbi:MAG: Gfo/Idh/MocA family oxidoreductase [Lentisphaeria bacterium]|nr:Gfo/Idh/MocA family oxidoreductase [Lentisphaeria bacterium]MBR2625891.1 Gfo/Idh/MocA family oxidoreductase [Lentisphaeria bacterium]